MWQRHVLHFRATYFQHYCKTTVTFNNFWLPRYSPTVAWLNSALSWKIREYSHLQQNAQKEGRQSSHFRFLNGTFQNERYTQSLLGKVWHWYLPERIHHFHVMEESPQASEAPFFYFLKYLPSFIAREKRKRKRKKRKKQLAFSCLCSSENNGSLSNNNRM